MQLEVLLLFIGVVVDTLRNEGRCSVMFLSAIVVVDTLRNKGKCSYDAKIKIHIP